MFVILSVRSSVHPPKVLSGLKSALSGLKFTLSGLKSALSGLESARADFSYDNSKIFITVSHCFLGLFPSLHSCEFSHLFFKKKGITD